MTSDHNSVIVLRVVRMKWNVSTKTIMSLILFRIGCISQAT
jgi:hypothetical protein